MQSVSEMAALERTDMLRQLIEMLQSANFSENTSLRGNVVIQYTNLYCIAEARSRQCLKLQFPR